ncbi:MAG TPA: tetratricopeptide repeat protein [Streptosporangiaceae bacterium]|nr:tetratricopeptide repeat protein [Streptosporangiaceae bacterium]
MVALSDDLFDTIECDAARTGDHRRAALRMTHLAETASDAGDMSRAEAYMRAGEQWLLADEPAVAADGFRRAMADGGPTFADPRVALARALVALGRGGEAGALIRELDAESAAGKRDPRTCDLVAELLAEQGDLPGALRWATAGAEECVRRGDQAELRLLLSLRYRIRNDLGLQEDDYDRLLDRLTDGAGAVPARGGEPSGPAVPPGPPVIPLRYSP